MRTFQSEDEKIWRVDGNDEPVGEGWQWRSAVEAGWTQDFRVINAFLRRKNGDLWIPRRGPNKRIFPNALDIGVSGHLTWPESYEDALGHEAMEEAGIDVAAQGFRELGYFSPKAHGLSAWMRVYEILIEDVPNWNRDDFQDAGWVSPTDLATRLDAGEPAKSDLRILLRLCYGV
jgi:isopentenyl-diphosphate delta-isomerase